ncbi:hypothetical protein [Deinococcus cavernae]|uniref:hypothetical protein n=1 Tax=Deinococcus cavernae TaxID=2320857 RepID=UPI0011C238BD|nr:hypothetical protein [Deinococcus cavernae]
MPDPHDAAPGPPAAALPGRVGAFLIPDHHTALDTLEELVGLHAQAGQERLNQAVVRAGLPLVQAQRDIGLRLYRDGDTVVYDVTPRAETFRYDEFLGPDFPALWVSWHELHLTRARAKQFQHELHTLVGGYLKDSGPERYLLRADFVQDIQDNPAQAASGNERPVT